MQWAATAPAAAALRTIGDGAIAATQPQHGSVSWKLVAAGAVIEIGWLMVGAASPRLTESDGFSQAMLTALPPVWAWGDALRRTATPEGAARLVFVAGLVLACLGFVGAIAAIRRSHVPLTGRWIGAGIGIFSATLLLSPGLLSTDLVMYAVYGRMAAVYGLNPYLAPPISISAEGLLGWASRTPDFARYATPYGPVWTALSASVAFATSETSPLAQTLAYRCIGVAAHVANAYLIWRLAAYVGSRKGQRSMAVLLYAWNPLALFEIVAGGHNDALMLSLVLAGLLIVFAGLRRAGATLVWAGALVKWVPAIVVVYVGCAELKTIKSWRARALWLAGLAALLVGVTLVFFGPWLDLQLPAALRSNTAAGGERYVNALLDLPTAWLVTHVIDRAGKNLPAAEASVRAVSFGSARLLLVLYVAWEALRLWRGSSAPRDILEASARTLLVALLVTATQVLAWYLIWPLALAAPLGPRSRLCQLTVAYSVLYLPIFYAIHEDMLPTLGIPPLLVSFVLLPLLGVLFVGGARPSFLSSRIAA